MDDQSKERIAAFIATATTLLSKLQSWQLGLVSAPSNASNSTEQASSTETVSIPQRGSPLHVEGMAKFRRRIQAEIDFLVGLEKGEVKFKKEHLLGSNLSHYAAIVDRIGKEGLANVNSISKIFRLSTSSQQGDSNEKSTPATSLPSKIEIDIVCRNRACWIKVKAMSAEGVSAVVNGTAPGGHKSVLELSDEVLAAARYNLIHYQPPAVVFSFSRGVSKKVSVALKKRGVFVEGDIVETPIADFEESSDEETEDMDEKKDRGDSAVESDDEEPESVNLAMATSRDISIVNLDVTTLITMASDLTNGFENENFADDILQQQALGERARLTMPDLEAFFAGKELIATEMAFEKFLNIVRIVGGPREKERAAQIVERVRSVPNAPSPEMLTLRAPKVKDQHRVIFGTGHALHATTATANTSFTATAKSAGLFLSLHIHPARALTEQRAAQFRAVNTLPTMTEIAQ